MPYATLRAKYEQCGDKVVAALRTGDVACADTTPPPTTTTPTTTTTTTSCPNGSEAPSERTVLVGSKVKLLDSRAAFENAFRGKAYVWNNAMSKLLGKTVTVVSRPNGDTFGLPKSDPNSYFPVWLYPLSVIASVECVGSTTTGPTTTTTPCECPLLCVNVVMIYVTGKKQLLTQTAKPLGLHLPTAHPT